MARLLIVDDDQAIRKGLEMLLAVAQHEVQAVPSGEVALQSMRGFDGDPPELIIADILMPGMSGLELVSSIRANPEWAKIPFLFITARRSGDTEREIDALGDAYLLYKPFEADQLRNAVASAVPSPAQ